MHIKKFDPPRYVRRRRPLQPGRDAARQLWEKSRCRAAMVWSSGPAVNQLNF